MTEVFQQGNFSNGRAGRSFFVFQSDLFQRHEVVRQARFALVHRRVGSLNITTFMSNVLKERNNTKWAVARIEIDGAPTAFNGTVQFVTAAFNSGDTPTLLDAGSQ